MILGPDSFETIRKTPIVLPPTQGETPPPASHGEILDAFLAEARGRKWKPGEVSGVVSRMGADLAAGFTLSRPEGKTVEGWASGLGVVRSTVWRTPLRFYCGAVNTTLESRPALVYHCWQPDRGTTPQELAGVVLDYWEDQANRLPRVLRELRQTKLSPKEAGTLLYEAGRARLPFGRTGAEKIMPGSRVFLVDALYRETGGKTGLDLLTCFGQVAQMNSPVDQLDQLAAFFGMALTPQPAGA
jgi:hypothetical protein